MCKPSIIDHNKNVKTATVFFNLKCQILLMQVKLVVMVTWPVAGKSPYRDINN